MLYLLQVLNRLGVSPTLASLAASWIGVHFGDFVSQS